MDLKKNDPFLDTNILVYANSVDNRAEAASQLLNQPFIVGVQTLNEFVFTARRKLGFSWSAVIESCAEIKRLAARIEPTSLEDFESGLAIGSRYNLNNYDALMLAIALGAGCDTFLTEDLHHGLVIDGRLTVRNPFL